MGRDPFRAPVIRRVAAVEPSDSVKYNDHDPAYVKLRAFQIKYRTPMLLNGDVKDDRGAVLLPSKVGLIEACV